MLELKLSGYGTEAVAGPRQEAHYKRMARTNVEYGFKVDGPSFLFAFIHF